LYVDGFVDLLGGDLALRFTEEMEDDDGDV
jgi:hypothetical protein